MPTESRLLFNIDTEYICVASDCLVLLETESFSVNEKKKNLIKFL